MIARGLLLLVVTALLATTNGQDYGEANYEQDYSQDSLYADYARQQQAKEVAGKAPFGWSKILIGTGIGWVVGGKVHAQRKEKKLNILHKKEQKALYSQYYNDVYQLQQQNAEMKEALNQLGYRVK
mmetsp:Transcript_22056/g.52234  ORF Transcript_22056/g.52234 Transcript_22056/m.52234 type:complete len:126 (-) Transcript_22056:380-757(-)